ncbi:hypothetical protein LTR85_001937 [Meristemomyces frigidus]|nr:hypothetical protein LTR85_001937 [Meristemomyces frigidus]
MEATLARIVQAQVVIATAGLVSRIQNLETERDSQKLELGKQGQQLGKQGQELEYLKPAKENCMDVIPLSKFPGPKLAALTLWYEFYYDVVKRGRYTWRIGEMHEKYGPIVRINPYELHINDPDYYDEIYTGPTKPRDKWAWSAAMFGNSSSHFGNSLSHFGAISHSQHRMLRAPLNPFFSKRSVMKLEPMITSKVQKLCERLQAFRDTREPVNLRYAFAAYIMDVVTEYAFGTSYECLEAPDFAPIWADAVDSVSEQSHMNKQFPWLLPIMRLMPLWLVERTSPHVMRLINFQIVRSGRHLCLRFSELTAFQDLSKQVSAIMGGKGVENTDNPSIFQHLLQTDELPGEYKTLHHLVDEGQSVVAAAQVTTTHYFNTTAYHIIANPPILAKLKHELQDAMPDGSLASWQKLEQLPYLNAVVNEGYRISYGPSHRLQRVSPYEPLIYHEYTIPPGTPVGMTNIFTHENPKYFPEPKVFRPERWLNKDSRDRLEKYLVNFCRGTRGCLGQHLAQAEILLGRAAVFLRFDFELYETTREDIDAAHDFFNPQPRKGSVGLRVIVN